MVSGGHSVDPQGLQAAAQFIKEVPADQLGTPLKDLQELEITSADFGREHTRCFKDFTVGVESAVKSIESYMAASEKYANALAGSGKAYLTSEQRATEDVKESGSLK